VEERSREYIYIYITDSNTSIVLESMGKHVVGASEEMSKKYIFLYINKKGIYI